MVHRLEQLSAQAASHPPLQVLEHPEQLPEQPPEQLPEQPPEQLLAQLLVQLPEHPPEHPEHPPRQPPRHDPEQPPVQLLAQDWEQAPLHPVEHDPVQLVQVVLHPVEHRPVHWAAQPVAAAVSCTAVNSLKTWAAFARASAVTFEPSAGVSSVPLMASMGTVIFWMCSFRIRPPVEGLLLYGLFA